MFFKKSTKLTFTHPRYSTVRLFINQYLNNSEKSQKNENKNQDVRRYSYAQNWSF